MNSMTYQGISKLTDIKKRGTFNKNGLVSAGPAKASRNESNEITDVIFHFPSNDERSNQIFFDVFDALLDSNSD
jgi:hypothetical protein